MEVTETGDNLIVVIECAYLAHHNWMALACWYSISKLLPDAEVVIFCQRQAPTAELFKWTKKCNVPFYSYRTEPPTISGPKTILKIPVTTMAVRGYDGIPLGPIPCQSEEPAVFVDYSQGCGKFTVSRWINRVDTPFVEAVKKLSRENCTVNEMKILKLWERLSQLYALL
jgi:hypothetical protein